MENETEKPKAITLGDMAREYNELEKKAFGLLMQIFYKVKKESTGYKDIRFSNGEVLSNCWNSPEKLDRKLYLHRFEREITSINEGLKK